MITSDFNKSRRKVKDMQLSLTFNKRKLKIKHNIWRCISSAETGHKRVKIRSIMLGVLFSNSCSFAILIKKTLDDSVFFRIRRKCELCRRLTLQKAMTEA